jgi:ATP:ADP antiporter, AAA family
MIDRISKLLNFRRGELGPGLLAALLFFLVLCGYFFLRPVREAMGVSRGMDELRWLFVVTSIASLVAVLAFGGAVSRVDRRRAIPIGYGFVIVCLLGFAGLLIADAAGGGGLIGSDSQTALSRNVGYTYYVWLSVINLFVTSLFWAFMVDIFNTGQGKRMFAFIGVGGTLGAMVGGWSTTLISSMTESPYLPAGLMLLGATLFAAAIIVVRALDRKVRRDGVGAEADHGATTVVTDEVKEERLGGSFWDGAAAVVRSPYLLGIGGYIALLAIANTMIYFTQANIILDSTDTFSQRVRSFALFDALAETTVLLTQLFITTRIIRRLGVGWTLAILPLVTAAGFAALALWPVLGMMAVFQALHRGARHAISRPARETLFGVLSPTDKYKAKPVVDVFVYRGGDVAGAGIDALLRTAGLPLAGIAAATIPFAAAWAGLSVWLGRAQKAREV